MFPCCCYISQFYGSQITWACSVPYRPGMVDGPTGHLRICHTMRLFDGHNHFWGYRLATLEHFVSQQGKQESGVRGKGHMAWVGVILQQEKDSLLEFGRPSTKGSSNSSVEGTDTSYVESWCISLGGCSCMHLCCFSKWYVLKTKEFIYNVLSVPITKRFDMCTAFSRPAGLQKEENK